MNKRDMVLRLLVQDFLSVSDLQKLKLSQLSLMMKRFKPGLHNRFALTGRITFVFMNYDCQ